MESDDTFVDIITEDSCVDSESAAAISVDESEDVDIISDFTFTEPESSSNTQSQSPPRMSHASESEDYGNFTTFSGDHNYCSTVSEHDTEQESVAKVIVESQQNEVLYCICRKPDIDQFMIGCDNCDEWYHGECIGITKQEAKKIKQFFCQPCQEKNSELHTKFKKIKEHGSTDDIEDEEKSNFKKRSNRRCGECAACKRQSDCGKCDYCKDMRKFGGPNKKRQKCRLRQCLSRSRHLLDGSSVDIPIEEQYQPHLKTLRRLQSGHNVEKKHAIKLKHTRHPQGREQKLKRQLSEKGLRRKKRLASRDNLGMSSEKTRQKSELPLQCYGPQCQKRTRPNSKYCSHECGIQVAVRRIQEILPGRVKEWNQTPCLANQNAEEKLGRLKKVQEGTRAKLLQLDKESKDLDDILERATYLTAVKEEETDVEQETDLDLTIYCVTCGIPLVPKVALRHMEKCYMKNESLTSFGSVYKSLGNLFCDFYNFQQGTYCKRLRVLCPEHTKEPKVSATEVCGCPLTNDQLEETGELCCFFKRNCVSHYCWEKLRRAQIDGQRVRQWLKLEEAYEQERSTRLAMAQRGGVLGMLLHRTIVES